MEEYADATKEGKVELDELLDSALQDFNQIPSKSSTGTKIENITGNLNSTVQKNNMLFGNTDIESALNQIFSGNMQGIENDNEAIAETVKKLSESTKDIEDNLNNLFKDLDMSENDESSLFPFIEGALQTFLCKDLLYPAMSEINEKYPLWLEKNKSNISDSDLKRFSKQCKLIKTVCLEFENETDNDSQDVKNDRFKKLLNLMQEMNECGEPPKEVVGDTILESGMPIMEPSSSGPQCPVS